MFPGMKALIQRVAWAKVEVDGKTVSSIDQGILTFLGVEKEDGENLIEKAVDKIIGLRIFEDDAGKMNLSLKDIGGQHLIVSQFTLAGDCSKGRRPSFVTAKEPDVANEFYQKAIEVSKNLGVDTQGGSFGADMKVSLLNDGPVTFHLDFE